MAAFIAMVAFWSCTSKQEKMEKKMAAFITAYEAKIIPLYKEMTITSWDANVSGSDADMAKSEKAAFEFAKVFTDSKAFAELKEIRESGAIQDPILKRQLDLLYDSYLGGQVDTALIAERLRMETEITKKYTNFRATVDGKELSDNEIEDILRNSTDSKKLQATWEASKMIGPVVADDIVKLVKLRNQIAQKLGFSNFHEMSLKLSGQDPAEVTAVFDELDKLTSENFSQLKNDIDTYFAKRYKVKVSDL